MTLQELAAAIGAEHERACGFARQSLHHGRRCGQLLLQAKARIRHGEWMAWVRENCEFSQRTADNYMRVAAAESNEIVNSQNAANLSVRAVLALLLSKKQARCEPAVPQVELKDLSPVERSEVRRIRSELDEFHYQGHTFLEQTGSGGTPEVIPGCAGAPVYWDIVGGDRDVGQPWKKYTRRQISEKLRAFLEDRRRSVVSDLVVDVARRRLAGDRTLSLPLLPLDRTATVSLDAEHVEMCAVLAKQWKTSSLDETVREAIRFACFSCSLEDDADDQAAPSACAGV